MKSDVYSQSNWLILKSAEMYFYQKKSQKSIAAELHISEATVSRLISRAKSANLVQFVIPDKYMRCLDYGKQIRERFGLRECVVALKEFIPHDWIESDIKNNVALEGARYLQRIVTDYDVLGVAWGGTVSRLIQLLNPCQRVDIPFVSLHGSIKDCNELLDVELMVNRMAMAFGGQGYSFKCNGVLHSRAERDEILKTPQTRKILSLFSNITISISGIGSFYPEVTSPYAKESFLKNAELQELLEKNVYGDFMLRFLDKNGQEVDSSLRDRTLAITLEQYRKIPRKIVVASGVKKTEAVSMLLRGGLVDVLIVDEDLAKAIIERSRQTN